MIAFNYPMHFCYSAASHTRFGGILRQVDAPHTAGCGGAQAFGVVGEVVKLGDFFDLHTQFLRKCSRVNFVA